MFKLLYDWLRTVGAMGFWRSIRMFPSDESELFNKYPKLAANHHVVEFICGALVASA